MAVSVAAFLFIICSAGALCQQSGQNADAASTPANAKSQPAGDQSGKKQPSGKAAAPQKNDSSGNNAFPLAQSEAAAKANTQRTDQQNLPAAPQTAAPANSSGQAANAASSHSSQRKRSTSQDNPFPEAQSKAAAKADAGNTQPGAPSAQGYSSSDVHLPAADLGQGNLGSHEKMDSFTRDQTQDGRIEDDLKVADLYMKNGNYRGALLRYQDAIQYDPQNDAALYGIADALCKENKTSEAMADFESYAKNNPQGEYALKAEKMIAHPNKCMHNW